MMRIEIFRKDSWDRWMDDMFIRQDVPILDRYKDRYLLEYIAVYSDSDVSRGAVKKLGVSEVPDSVAGIKARNSYDKREQRWAVLREQVKRESDYWVLETAAYEAPDEIAWFAFSRITGCGMNERWDDAECGLKQGVSRSDIEQLCREMIERKGPYAYEAKEWLSKLGDISDEQLAEWAAPKTERSWDRDPTEKLKRSLRDLNRENTAVSEEHAGVVLGHDIMEAVIRSIYDAYIYKLYADEHPRGSALIFDDTLDQFAKQVVRWYESRRKRAVSMIASVRNVLGACEAEYGELTDEQIREIAYTETDDKHGHGFYIGVDLLYGFETEGDAAESVRPLTEAAEAGNRYAAEELIDIYEEGIGVKKNPWLVKKLREKYDL